MTKTSRARAITDALLGDRDDIDTDSLTTTEKTDAVAAALLEQKTEWGTRVAALLLHAAENPPPRLLELFAEMEAEGYSALTDEKLAEMREIMRRLTLDLHSGPTLDALIPG